MIDLTKTEYAIVEADRRNIHNGLCDLYFSLQHLEEVLHPSAMKRLRRGYDLIKQGFADVARQEEEVDDAKRELYHRVTEELDVGSIWSMSEVTDFDSSFRKHYGIEDAPQVAITYQGVTVMMVEDEITWKDLFKAADKAIKLSGDTHHIFIEGFHVERKDGQTSLMLSTGS